jgi:hypothetical protein
MRIYRFYITIGSTETEVFPLNFLESAIVDERQDIPRSYYRQPFQGTLTFVNNNGGDDFDLLYSAELVTPCDPILLRIERVGVTYWEGQFSTTDGTWDIDKCTFTVTPKLADDYVDILDRADIQHNILDIATEVTSRALLGATYKDYTHNRWLTDVIDYLASDASIGIKPGCNLSYDFFTDATNYVTENDNHLTLLTLAQKSDIKRPEATNPATTAMLSWNELMDILWGMFQVCWDYDAGTDTINVEHISWFTQGAGIDLRTQTITQMTNKYKYIKDKMPKYESWHFTEADDLNFVGTPIYYDSKCVDPDPDTNIRDTIVNITTDLEYIIENDDAIADEGFVMLCNYEDGGNYYVEFEMGELFATVKLNMHLSVANLHHRYFRHNRVLIEGYMNGIFETFWSAQKTKEQECFAIICPDTGYDPNDLITTELGETWFGGEKAQVHRGELKPSGEMKFTLRYGPEDNENTGIEDTKTIKVIEVGDLLNTQCTYYFLFSHPADAALVADPPQIRIQCQDATLTSCTTGWFTPVVNLGDYSTSVVADWCVPAGGPPICVLNRDTTQLKGAWDFADLDRDDTVSC